ncbi:hypothetical protein M8C21_014846, partial [Ambrosia artemisiifolia]
AFLIYLSSPPQPTSIDSRLERLAAVLWFWLFVFFNGILHDLPERYKDLHLKDAFPVGRVVLTIDEVSSWNAKSLPTAYVNHHFNGQAPDHPIIIDFNNKHRWIVEIKILSRAYYITDGWTVIKEDLKLFPGAFIVFE